MIDRISKNEAILDKILLNSKNLEESLNEFINNQKNIELISKYYGSKAWFKDKEDYENKKIFQVKAGVLSEDLVFDTLENIDEIICKMEKIINIYHKKRDKIFTKQS